MTYERIGAEKNSTGKRIIGEYIVDDKGRMIYLSRRNHAEHIANKAPAWGLSMDILRRARAKGVGYVVVESQRIGFMYALKLESFYDADMFSPIVGRNNQGRGIPLYRWRKRQIPIVKI